MGLIIKRSSGSTGYRPCWYIRYTDETGNRVEKPIGIPIDGKPPKSLRLKEQGDAAFERSRFHAEEYLKNFLKELKLKGSVQELTRVLIEAKTGRKLVYVRIDELFAKWSALPRCRARSQKRIEMARAAFTKFAKYLRESKIPNAKSAQYLYEVTPEMAEGFIAPIRATCTVSTTKDYLSLLNGTFASLLPAGTQSPFKDIRYHELKADNGNIHRDPLTNDQLQALYATAKSSQDAFLYPITVCAAETGMRIGDVCMLKWTSVHLKEGYINTCTRKTCTNVSIPIFPLLRTILETAETAAEDDTYVFPEAAQMYRNNYSGIISRGKNLFANALFHDIKAEVDTPTDVIEGENVPPLTTEKLLKEIDKDNRFIPSKKERAKIILVRYKSGESYSIIAKALGIRKAIVSQYLADIEELTGEKIRPGIRVSPIKKRLAQTRKRHTQCVRATSIYGWHSLRANFCVQAIFRHIPEKIICDIVGHSTFETTKNYLNPTWEVFRDAWNHGLTSAGSIPRLPNVQTAASVMSPEMAKQILATTLTPEQLAAFKVLGMEVREPKPVLAV